MTRYLPKVKERKVKNLLNKMSEDSEQAQEVWAVVQNRGESVYNNTLQEEPDVIVSHWHKVCYVSKAKRTLV